MSDREYDTPEETLDYLKDHEVGSDEYIEATAYLHDYIEKDVRMGSVDAINAVRHLNKGEVDKAEDLIEDLL